jgi:hypothetical protein
MTTARMPPGASARSASAASLVAKRPSSSSVKTPAATSARRSRRRTGARAFTAFGEGLSRQRLGAQDAGNAQLRGDVQRLRELLPPADPHHCLLGAIHAGA